MIDFLKQTKKLGMYILIPTISMDGQGVNLYLSQTIGLMLLRERKNLLNKMTRDVYIDTNNLYGWARCHPLPLTDNRFDASTRAEEFLEQND